MSAEARLVELGIVLPEAPKPIAAYIPAVRSGNLVFTSGQLPVVNGEVAYQGKVGAAVSVEDGYQSARTCTLNALSVIRAVAGSLDAVEQVVKVGVFVNSAAGCFRQPEVANGASDLLIQVFGEQGRHARTAVGCAELPRDSATELELVVRLRD